MPKPRAAFPFGLSFLLCVVLAGAAANAGEAAGTGPGGERRLLAFLSTDKPIYRPGETVRLRAVALRGDTFLPIREALPARLEVNGPGGKVVATQGALSGDSVAGFSWTVPPDAPGGRYRAIARVGESPATERTFEIRAYRPRRLRSQIEFPRRGYGPGDEVVAVANITRAEGGVPVGAAITAIARVDGREAARVENIGIDAAGNCRVAFVLPGSMEKGEGTLALLIEDGGVVETAAKTIPILLRTLDIAFYPEGGELVAGLPGRVYVQARRPDGEPVDIEGEIVPVDADGGVDRDGPVVALSTAHEGRGVAAFAPEPGRRYALRLLRPSGIAGLFPLPEVLEAGVSVRADKPAYAYDEPILLSVDVSPGVAAAEVTLFHRDREVARAPVGAGKNAVALSPLDSEGVLMATVWDAEGRPLAERLVFRKPRYALAVDVRAEVVPDGGAPTPGARVRLTVEARDENGRPAEAVAAISVTDDALLEMVDRRVQAPTLPVMAYLENEVAELADARAYFDPANPDADRDIDLLLGTQGWRRFILVRSAEDPAASPAARRAMAAGEPLESYAGMEVPFREGEPPPPAPSGMAWTLIQKPAKYDTVTEIVTIRPQATFQVPVPGEYVPRLAVPKGLLDGSAEEEPGAPQPPSDNAASDDRAPPAPLPDSAPAGEGASEDRGKEASETAEDGVATALEPFGAVPDPDAPDAIQRRISRFPAELNWRLADAKKTTRHVPSPDVPGASPIPGKVPGGPDERGTSRIPEKRDSAPRRTLREPAKMVWLLEDGKESVPFSYIREYAHQAGSGRAPEGRDDFTETLYWNAGVRTNPRDGTASVLFDLSDSVTTFRVRVDAFADNGALGAGTGEIASLRPFHVEAKLPPALIAGDRPAIPAALVNATTRDLEDFRMEADAGEMRLSAPALPGRLPADSRGRVLLELLAEPAGEHRLAIAAAAGGHADEVVGAVRVLPRGFPMRESASGVAKEGAPFSARLTIPGDVVPGSVVARAKLFPSPLANMEEALAALIRRPHGCFEQTTSTLFPLVMAQRYFTSRGGASPERIREAAGMLEEGLQRLLDFKSPEGGFDWFGKDPGDEVLTAYVLTLFMEMRRIMPMDAELVSGTREWLLARRDGEGGFRRRGRRTLCQVPAEVADAYILRALLESGENPETLAGELAAAEKALRETDDPYRLALGADVFALAGNGAAARAAADRLRALQAEDGRIAGAAPSATNSLGVSLDVETTSLAAMAWLRLGDAYAPPVERAVAWVYGQRADGRFGSTQSTVLALKAINAYASAFARMRRGGDARLVVDGAPVGPAVRIDANGLGAIEFPDFSAALTPGRHDVLVVVDGGDPIPASIDAAYAVLRPISGPECPLTLATALSDGEVAEGEPVELLATLTAKDRDVHMPLAVIGLPAGLEPRHERLGELAAEGRIESYEILGRELILYWRGLAAGEKVELAVPLLADIPGVYTAPASRAYAYYFDEHVHWIPGESVRIRGKL